MKDLSESSLSFQKKGYVSLGPASSTNDAEEQGDDDIDLSDICEVVISLKCKKCEFLCNDKATLGQHIRQTHVPNSKASFNGTESKINGSSSKIRQEIQYQPDRDGRKAFKGPSPKVESASNHNHTKVKAKASASISKPPPADNETRKQSRCNSKSYQNQNSSSDTGDDVQDGEDNAGDESVEDVFLCADCDIVFSSRETCCSHMHKVHGLKQFSADFIQEEIISKPTEEQKSAKRRKSQMPRKFTPDSGTVVPKKYRVTKDIFHSCKKCTIKFENVDVMKFHEKCHLTASVKGEEQPDSIVMPKGFFCPVCDSNETGTGADPQLFPKWAPCAWHLWKEHRIDCELYTCSVCKQFKSHLSARVKDHEQLHSSKASYKCKTCNKTFKQLKQLRCHEKYHKDNSTKLAPEVDSRWYTPKECPICNRILSDSKCLKKHISAVHNKLKPYVCNICGHTSARKQELLLHVRQHTGEKPYKCPICPFQTGDHNSLRKHKLRHSDERPYACSYCDYRCIQSCAFKKHILACHPGQEVVFLCQLCSHKSVNETVFAAHQKEHADHPTTVQNNNGKNGAIEAPPSTSSDDNDKRSKITTHSWSGDDDSLDIIDNGGMTIPATPTPAPPSPKSPKVATSSSVNSKTADRDAKKAKRKCKKEIAKSTTSSPSNGATFPSASNSSIASIPTSDNSIYLNKLPAILEPRDVKPTIIVCGATNDNANSIQLQPVPIAQPSQLFCATPPLPSPSLPSPRYIPVNSSSSNSFPATSVNPDGIQQDIRTHNNTEDPESSTSEVITNPHQLIQNIQLTPLDLTDIINCNEQSNDDGMLQRLLDMSGV